MVHIVPANGACQYNAAVAHVYGDPEYGDYLRRQAHDLVLRPWPPKILLFSFVFLTSIGEARGISPEDIVFLVNHHLSFAECALHWLGAFSPRKLSHKLS